MITLKKLALNLGLLLFCLYLVNLAINTTQVSIRNATNIDTSDNTFYTPKAGN